MHSDTTRVSQTDPSMTLSSEVRPGSQRVRQVRVTQLPMQHEGHQIHVAVSITRLECNLGP